MRWPWSVKILIAVVVLFLFQAFPYTGVFLMLFAAPLWAAPLMNLAILVVGFEALTGRIPRGFLLVPVLWFGLYAIAVVREEAGLAKARHVVSQVNASVKPIDYDPGQQNIVAEGFAGSIRLKNFVDKLLLHHALPVVYYEAGRGQNRTMWAVRLATGSLCDSIAKREQGATVKVSSYHRSSVLSHDIDGKSKVCTVAFSERPDRQQIIRVSQRRTVEQIGGLSVQMHITRASSETRQAESRGASAAVLRRFPIPILGCALNSGAPSWDCFATFMRQKTVRFGERAYEKINLNNVLRFSNSQPPAVDQAANLVVLERLRDADKRFDDMRFALLEDFLQNPATLLRDKRYKSLLELAPEKLSPFADRIVSALLESADNAKRIDEKTAAPARAMAQLAARLPDADIQHYSAQILSVLDRRKQRWHNNIRPLMRRTASLGHLAVPMLIRRLERHNRQKRLARYEADAVIALCRMGLPHAKPAGPTLLDIWRRRNSKRQTFRRRQSNREHASRYPSLDRADKYVYLALLRLGLGDEAERLRSVSKSKWWTQALQAIGPQSPAETCEDV